MVVAWTDLRDPVAGNDDVDRATRRPAGAVDQHRATNDQRLERAGAFAAGAVGRRCQRFPLQWLFGERLRGILRRQSAASHQRQPSATSQR